MSLINITKKNFEQFDIPCFDLNNPDDKRLFNYKQDWLRHQFENGLVIKKITSPKEGFIEYIEAEHSWKPVYAPGYILIHHLHVPDDYSDQRIKKRLLQDCENEHQDKNGIAIILEDQYFKEHQSFFIQLGYLEYAHLRGFTLLVKKFKPEALTPLFVLSLNKKETESKTHQIKITYTDQSIFIDYHVHEMRRVFRDMGFDVQLKKLDSAQDAWESGSPHGTFGVFMDEYFLTHKILNKKEIELLVGSLELDEIFTERNYPGEGSV